MKNHVCTAAGFRLEVFIHRLENVKDSFRPLSPQCWLVSTALLLETRKYSDVCFGSVTEAEGYLFKLLQISGVCPPKTEKNKSCSAKGSYEERTGWMDDGWMMHI